MTKIESGVPIPRNIKPTGTTATLRALKIGDSFVTNAKFQKTAHTLARYVGIKVATRSISDEQVRVWRIE